MSLLALLLVGVTVTWPSQSQATPLSASTPGALTARREAAVVDLLLVRRRLADVEQELRAANAQLKDAEQTLAQVQTLEADAAGDFEDVNRRFSQRTRETYKQGRTGWLEVLVNSADLGDFLARLDLLGKVLTDESRLIDEVAAKRAAMRGARTELEQARREQAAVVRRLSDARLGLQDAERQQQALADRLGEQLRAAEEAARQAEAEMEALNRAAAERAAAPGTEAGPSPRAGGSVQPSRGAGDGGDPTSRRTTRSTSPEAPVDPVASVPGKQLQVKVTAYCLPGTTATGVPVGRGVIAVDPRVIPLGTRLLVPGYGEGIAADTGGAVKGNFIDVWLPEGEANSWGVKYLTITILG